MGEKTIDLKEVQLKGNVLDIGQDNYGIIYNLFKNSNKKEMSIEYIEGINEKDVIEKNYYDTVVIFFYLSSFWNNLGKKSIVRDIFEFLKKDGEIYIWDVDKKRKKIFDNNIKVILPENKSKSFRIRDYNLIKEFSKNDTINLIKNYFDIIDIEEWEDIYFIRAKKKERITYEDNAYSDKLKVYTQQFSSKIFKGLHKRIKLPGSNKRILNK